MRGLSSARLPREPVDEVGVPPGRDLEGETTALRSPSP